MRVLRSPTGPLDQTDPANRPITFEDLLTHRSGLTYGAFHPGPLARAYEEALGGDIDSEVAPNDWITRLAALPLIAQPGAAFHYGCLTDLLGLLIARIEDAPLSDVIDRRIFGPLGMKDTGFTLPREKRSRRAGAYGFDEAGCLTALRAGPGGSFMPERPEGMTYVSVGGWWRADPRDNSVLIFLSHNMVELEQREKGIGLGVYAAITQFQALASASPA